MMPIEFHIDPKEYDRIKNEISKVDGVVGIDAFHTQILHKLETLQKAIDRLEVQLKGR